MSQPDEFYMKFIRRPGEEPTPAMLEAFNVSVWIEYMFKN
jgi:hypothetical protein